MQTLDSVLVQPLPQAQRARRTVPQLRAFLALLAAQFVDLVLTWQRRASEPAALAAMNERELRDIGLARSEVRAEAHKPFWRA